jgi:hypothetical protein
MADISMCSGEGCDIKLSCHRHTAVKNPYFQAYFQVPPIVGKNCDQFWSNIGYNKDKELKMPRLQSISELTPEQQDKIRNNLNEYYVSIDPRSYEKYIRVYGIDISYKSIVESQLLEE